MPKLTRLNINTSVGYYRTANDADGADYDYDADTITVSMSRELYWKIRGGFNYAFTASRYDNPTSLSGAGFGFKRRDYNHSLGVGLSRPVRVFDKTDVNVFAQYNYADNASSVPEFKYFQHSFNVGVSKRF